MKVTFKLIKMIYSWDQHTNLQVQEMWNISKVNQKKIAFDQL